MKIFFDVNKEKWVFILKNDTDIDHESKFTHLKSNLMTTPSMEIYQK